MDKSEKVILLVLAAVIVLCGLAALIFSLVIPPSLNIDPKVTLAVTSRVEESMAPTVEASPTAISMPDEPSQAEQTFSTLKNTIIPPADLQGLAYRLKGQKSIPAAQVSQPVEYSTGDQLDFWVIGEDDIFQRVTATLQYASENVYFWIENSISFSQEDLQKVMKTFSTEVYSRNQEFFGSEWLPGVDNDPHLFILYAGNIGDTVAGYTASTDSVTSEIHPYSNMHEMFVINANIQTLSDPYTLSVMAHEYQHLIHQFHDPNEELWINEGFSELSTLINGFQTGGFDTYFLRTPDLQLNNWAYTDEDTTPHYGASYLFTAYLLGRFGEETTQAIVANPKNGLESIDNVFQELEISDPVSGEIYSADHLFSDWAAANFLEDESVADGRYFYAAYPGAPQATPSEVITDCRDYQAARTVAQYGTDYIQIQCAAESVFTFSGLETVPVLPVEIPDGGSVMWSNTADSSDTTMTRMFDFSGIDGQITASFDLWYELEEDYDFGYFLASENGTDWQIIDVPGCTDQNLSGNNYGCGINGSSEGWIPVTVDLSAFAGKKVWLRFEMVTDGAVLGEGLAIDRFFIPEIDYLATFNVTSDGWMNEGFVRLNNQLPQTFLISVIDEGVTTRVDEYTVQPGRELEIDIRGASMLHPVTVVISGSTRYTRQDAFYQISISEKARQ